MLIWNVSIASFFGMFCIFYFVVQENDNTLECIFWNVHWSFIFLLYVLRVSLTARRGAGDPWEWLKSETRGHAASLHTYPVCPAFNSLQVWGGVPVLFFFFYILHREQNGPQIIIFLNDCILSFQNCGSKPQSLSVTSLHTLWLTKVIIAWSSLRLWQHAATCHTLGEIVTKLQEAACWMPQA